MVDRLTLLSVVTLCLAPALRAQDRPPVLLVKLPDKASSEPVRLQRLEVDAHIHGFLSETTLTMAFYNPHDRVLEGAFPSRCPTAPRSAATPWT
jgi:hypothetical protein